MRCVRFTGSRRTSSATVASERGSKSSNKKTPPPGLTSSPSTSLNHPMTRQHHLQLQQQKLQLQKQQQHQQQQQVAVNEINPASGNVVLSVIGAQSDQSDLRVAISGGRHPHPPSGNSSKLKHKCPFDGCPWKFATPYKLRRHIKSHTKETPFLCKECNRGFSVRYNLLMHIQTIHSQPQRFKCPAEGCNEAFHTQPRLNGHLRRIHKKDWKTLQAAKTSSTTKGGNRTSSTSSVESVDSDTSRLECSECNIVFPTQSKLNQHLKSHSTDKTFKCTVQSCSKVFPTKEKLSKHLEVHKTPKQFCCPHENCNRVFLRQSHLKNHLKIHTKDSFACPVLDCGKKFVSESEYNLHLNTHINYGHKCQFRGCGLTFPSHKRLELHCRVMHGIELPGHHPFLPTLLGHSHPLPPPTFHPSPPSLPQHTHPLRHESISEFEDVIREVNLPGLSPDEIEALLSENSDLSGEQFKNFFHSAVELSEIEAKLFSSSEYESDSGYSTYDVSPITSSAPMQFGGCRPSVSTSYRSISPALTPVNPSSYISLSSSNPFQYASSSVHMSTHQTPCTTPLPHSAHAHTEAEFSFFPPHTPTFHSSMSKLPIMPAVHEAFASQQHPTPHTFPTPVSQYQQEYPLIHYTPMHHETQRPQPDTFRSDFSDLLGDITTPKNCVGEVPQSMQRALVSTLHLPLGKGQVRVKSEHFESEMCSNLSYLPLVKNQVSVKNEQNENEMCCNLPSVATSNLPSTTYSTVSLPVSMKHNETPTTDSNKRQSFSTSPTAMLSSPPIAPSRSTFKSFLATCSKLPVLREFSASTTDAQVFTVAVATIVATLTKQPSGTLCGDALKASLPDGPINVDQLQARVAKMTPTELEKLGNSELLSAAKTLAAIHVASHDMKEETVSMSNTVETKDEMSTPQLTSMLANNDSTTTTTIPCVSPRSVKIRVVPKPHHKSRVNRVSTHSPVKCGQKKKTQWPRSMNKANLMAFREHILNKLKKGQDEMQGLTAQQQQTGNPTPSSGYKVTINSENNSIPERCSSAPADALNTQLHSPSPSPLQTSYSAGNISQIFENSKGGDTDRALHFNPDILLSSSILGLPDSLLDEIDSQDMAALTDGTDDFSQLLGDSSPPSSVAPLIQTMELSDLQEMFVGSSENSSMSNSDFSSHFAEPSTSPTATSMHCALSSTHGQSFTEGNTPTTPVATSMADLGSMFNESFSSIASVEAMADANTPLALEDNLDSIFQRSTDPLLACTPRLHW